MYRDEVRLAIVTMLVCGTAAAQQQPGLGQFLALTPAQVTSIQQLNSALNQFISTKSQRSSVLNSELAAENAKPAADPQALGQRNIELDSINRAIAAEQAAVQEKVTALLTPAQRALVGRISEAIVQQSLLRDAGCGYLLSSVSGILPSFGVISINGVFSSFASFLLGDTGSLSCPAEYPISIRNYLALTDAEVSGILALQSAYNALKLQKDNRTADVQAELRDETAKPTLDPLALGVRYVELASISREIAEAGSNGRKAARTILTGDQQNKLKSLMDLVSLLTYQFPALSCHLLSFPPGTTVIFAISGNASCQLN